MVYTKHRELWPLTEVKMCAWIPLLAEPEGVKTEAENLLLLGLASDHPATVCISLVFLSRIFLP